MNILIVYFEPVIGHMLHEVLELEGHTVTMTQSVSEAMRALEESSDPFLLFTDNLHVNPEVRVRLAVLHDRPDLRDRVWVVNEAVWSDPVWTAAGLIDEHLRMPYTVEQLLDLIDAHAKSSPY